jgi:hypothetical protein
VRSKNLKSGPDYTDGEVETLDDGETLGAAAFAGRKHPLAMALMRLFVGDNHAAGEVVQIMAVRVWGKAQADGYKLRRVQSEEMAQKVLAWHRDGACRACGGHGYLVIPGTTSIGEVACGACRGSGRVPFEREFTMEHLWLARWLLAEVERETAKAGPAAMAALAPRPDIP